MVRTNFENMLNDLIQFQQNMNRNKGIAMVLHLHLIGGNCITMGHVKRHQTREMNGENICFLEYYDKNEKLRQAYFVIDSVSAIVALEV